MLRNKMLAPLAIAMISAAHAVPLDFLGAPCTGSVCDNGMECLSLSGGKCTWDGYRAHALCTCGGVGGETDPYFTGFTGQSFYLSAEADNIYNLFSEQSHFVNALFVATELPQESDLLSIVSGARNSSFIGALALKHGSTLVVISSDREGDISVKINGNDLDLGSEDRTFESTIELPSNVSVTIDKHPYLYTSTLVTVETELLAVTVFPERAHEDNMGNPVRGHLSLQMSLNVSSKTAPCTHGVLGITTRKDVTSDVQDAFPGEGQLSDYIVPSLSSSDFAYGLYDKPASSACPQIAATPADGIASSRKLLNGSRPQIQNARLEASFGVLRPQRQAERQQ